MEAGSIVRMLSPFTPAGGVSLRGTCHSYLTGNKHYTCLTLCELSLNLRDSVTSGDNRSIRLGLEACAGVLCGNNTAQTVSNKIPFLMGKSLFLCH